MVKEKPVRVECFWGTLDKPEEPFVKIEEFKDNVFQLTCLLDGYYVQSKNSKKLINNFCNHLKKELIDGMVLNRKQKDFIKKLKIRRK